MNKSILIAFSFAFCVNANPLLYYMQMQRSRNEQINSQEILKTFELFQRQVSDYNDYYGFVADNYQESLNGKAVHPEWGLNTVQLIKKHGYPVETHTVTTEDGYKLKIHRIPYGKNDYYDEARPIVLVWPGILCSSADWVVNGPDGALAYLLADAGYDVWLGNPRGTTPSRSHVTLKPNKDKEFWNFSFHEMGTQDLPTMIDYILEKTQQPNLHYIAHSQGATSFFALASERPEYNNKIRLATVLAPVTYSSNVKNPFVKLILPFLDQLIQMTEELDINEILRHTAVISLMGQVLCNDEAPTQDLCSLILFLATGFDEPQLNKTMLPVLYSNFPAGGSVKQFWHFAQNMKSGKFRNYDYGPEKNLELYGQEDPADYDLSKVTAPVASYCSLNDWISSEVDVRLLTSELPNVVVDHLIEYEKFNHMDHMWATDGKTLLYEMVLEVMRNY